MMDGGPVAIWVYHVGTLVLMAGLLCGLAFGLIYGLSAPWWRTPIGRMFMAGAFAVVVGIASVVYLIITGPGPSDLSWARIIPRLVGYLAFTAALVVELVTFLHERRKTGPGRIPVAPELFWVIRRLFRPRDRRG